MTNTAIPYHKKFNCSLSLYAQFVCPLPKCKENILHRLYHFIFKSHNQVPLGMKSKFKKINKSDPCLIPDSKCPSCNKYKMAIHEIQNKGYVTRLTVYRRNSVQFVARHKFKGRPRKCLVVAQNYSQGNSKQIRFIH